MDFMKQLFLHIIIFQNNIQVYVISGGIEIGCRDMKHQTIFASAEGIFTFEQSFV